MIRKFFLHTFLVLLCFQLFSCGSDDSKNFPGGNMPAQVKDFKVLTLNPRGAKVNLDFPATIQGQQVIEIRPKIDGYVDAIYIQEGAAVKKGQLLFRISNPQYEQEVITASAMINSAEADVDAAKMQVAKVRPLVEKDIVSKYELESAQYALTAKEAALSQAKAALSNAHTNAGYTILRSPANGVIGTIPYKVGALINSTNTSPLTTLSNIEKVYAYYSLNEKQLLQYFSTLPGTSIQEKIKNILPATLLLADGGIYPQKGKIEMASGLISTETGTATFKAIYPNPLGILRSGASATVRVTTIFDTSLVIPQSATYELQDKRFIYTVGKDNKVASSAITAVPSDNGQYFIVTDGLKTGDVVVLEGLIGLRDSTQINPKQANVDSVYAKLK
ncbi:MAG: efflux RND transporter periplasmic adaptor subunit [Ginsengibacter sp.]